MSQSNNEPAEVGYVHMNRMPESKGGVVTVAYRRTSENIVRYALAFCSPLDQFCRKRGRDISRGRLEIDIDVFTLDHPRKEKGLGAAVMQAVEAELKDAASIGLERVCGVGVNCPRWV
jgi:hypothetical protein